MSATFTCLSCNSVNFLQKNTTGKYCSNHCQMEHLYFKNVKRWLSGEEKGWTGRTAQLKNFVRRWLFETRGARCELCLWDKRHPNDGSILVEIDHIDGNAHNCSPENLRILCPNCHSMTDTFRARNKKSKRNRSAVQV